MPKYTQYRYAINAIGHIQSAKTLFQSAKSLNGFSKDYLYRSGELLIVIKKTIILLAIKLNNKMKRKILLIFLLILTAGVYAQKTPPRIKVYLLGTFHFAQANNYNVLDEVHQKSIQELNDVIVGIKPEKIFIERMPEFEKDNKIDSIYTAWLNSTDEMKSRNEIWQVAFKVGKRLGHKKLYQCDNPGNYGTIYSKIAEYVREYNQQEILSYKARGTTTPLTKKVNTDSLRNSVTLLDYIKWLNSKEVQSSSQAHYINVYPQAGNTDVYNFGQNYLLGTELTVDWYRRNIYIYSKIINQLNYEENSIFLLMGNDHMPIIRHLFESNPYFEVVDVEKWLGKTSIKNQ